MDVTPICVPSKLYLFSSLEDKINLDIKSGEHETDITECAMVIEGTDETVTNHVMSLCHGISKHQEVTDLWLQRVQSTKLTVAETPILSRNFQSLTLDRCVLPAPFVKSILHQLSHCGHSLQSLVLRDLDLKVEQDLDELLENIVSYYESGMAQSYLRLWLEGEWTRTHLSEGFVDKWKQRCEGISSVDCRIER